MADDKEIKVKIGAETKGLTDGMASATAGIKSAVSQMEGHFSGLSSMVSNLQTPFIALGALLAGGALFGKAIEGTTEWTTAVVKLSQKLGITTEEGSAMEAMLHKLGISGDDFGNIVTKMTRQMKLNEDGFKALGVHTKDANGEWRGSSDVMFDVLEKLNGVKAGTDRNVAAMAVFGGRVGDLTMLLRANRAALEEARERAEALNLVVGPDGARDSLQYKEAMRELHLVGQGFAMSIGKELLPLLTELAQWFAEVGPPLIKGIGAAFKGLATIIETLGFVAGLAAKLIATNFKNMVIGAQAAWDALQAIIVGETDSAATIIKNSNNQINNNNKRLLHEMGKDWEAYGDKLGKIWDGTGAKSKALSGDTLGGDDLKGKKDKEQSQMPEFKAALEAKKDLLDAFHQMSKRDEEVFWTEMGKTAGLSTKDLAAVNHERIAAKKAGDKDEFDSTIANLKLQLEEVKDNGAKRVAIATEVAALAAEKYGKGSKEESAALREITKIKEEERKKQEGMDDLMLDRTKAHALASVDLERQTLAFKKSMGVINATEELASLRALDDEKYTIEKDALQKKLELSKDDTKHQAELNKELEALDDAHKGAILKNQQDTTLAVKAKWDGILGNITSAFSSSIQGMIQGTVTFQKALANIWQSIIAEFVGMAVKMGVQWLTTQIGMTVAHTTAKTTQAVTDKATAATSAVTAKATALSEIAGWAGVAGAAAMASVAAIPFYGWAMAIPTGETVMAAAMGMMGVASAAGGWGKVPHDQVAQIHKDEMVLPANYAEPLRAMLEGGGMGGVGGGGQQIHLHLNAIDMKSGHQWLEANANKIGDLLKAQARRNRDMS